MDWHSFAQKNAFPHSDMFYEIGRWKRKQREYNESKGMHVEDEQRAVAGHRKQPGQSHRQLSHLCLFKAAVGSTRVLCPPFLDPLFPDEPLSTSVSWYPDGKHGLDLCQENSLLCLPFSDKGWSRVNPQVGASVWG